MLTGKPPFESKGEDLITQIKTQQPIRPSILNPEIDKEIDPIVMTCLAKYKKESLSESGGFESRSGPPGRQIPDAHKIISVFSR